MLLAFVKNGEEPGLTTLTLANFARFFTALSYQRALWNSVYSGLMATGLATAIALPMAAFCLVRGTSFRRARNSRRWALEAS